MVESPFLEGLKRCEDVAVLGTWFSELRNAGIMFGLDDPRYSNLNVLMILWFLPTQE